MKTMKNMKTRDNKKTGKRQWNDEIKAGGICDEKNPLPGSALLLSGKGSAG